MGLGKLTKVEIEATPAMVAEFKDSFFSVGTGTPIMTAYYDRSRKLRRITARYPDGWQMQVNIDAEGSVTSSSAKLKLSVRNEGDNAQG